MKVFGVKKTRKLLRTHPNILSFIQLMLDCITTGATLSVLAYFKTGRVSIEYDILMILSILIMLATYQHAMQYRYDKSFTRCLLSRFKAWSLVIFILLFIGFITKGMNYYSREVLSAWAILAFVFQVINYFIFTQLMLQLRKKHIKPCNALVIGVNHTAEKLIFSVNNNTLLRHKIVGFVGGGRYQQREADEVKGRIGYEGDTKPDDIHGISYLGGLDKLDNIIEQYDVKCIYIALSSRQLDQLEPLYLKLMLKDIVLHWVPDISTLNLINHHVKEISGMPVLTLSESPLAGEQVLIKTFFDVVLSLIILAIISPLMLLIALLIKITSPGPVLFCQERHGRDNKVFNIYKFRSMKVHQETNGKVTQAKQGDDRITFIGRLIRRTSIDELPQLLNVIKGDMSLVGPRPHAISHNDYFQQQIDNYLTRHKIKPGITGLAQITGFRGETDTLDKMNGRVQQDIAYINNWSLTLDIEILLKTAFSLILDKAY